jgi:hypothetical protein
MAVSGRRPWNRQAQPLGCHRCLVAGR